MHTKSPASSTSGVPRIVRSRLAAALACPGPLRTPTPLWWADSRCSLRPRDRNARSEAVDGGGVTQECHLAPSDGTARSSLSTLCHRFCEASESLRSGLGTRDAFALEVWLAIRGSARHPGTRAVRFRCNRSGGGVGCTRLGISLSPAVRPHRRAPITEAVQHPARPSAGRTARPGLLARASRRIPYPWNRTHVVGRARGSSRPRGGTGQSRRWNGWLTWSTLRYECSLPRPDFRPGCCPLPSARCLASRFLADLCTGGTRRPLTCTARTICPSTQEGWSTLWRPQVFRWRGLTLNGPARVEASLETDSCQEK